MAEDLRQSLEDMIKKFATDLDLPKVEFDKLIDTYERNLDSIVQTAVAAADAVRATAAKERETLKAAMNDALEMAKAMKPGSDPKLTLSRESEAVGHAFETAVSSTAAIAEQIIKLNTEVFQLFVGRLSESTHEIRESVRPGAPHDEPKA
ncbi:MAG TPA: TIGR01841 family phasin [Roseiarcus sp.]|nr:TIGR01841 family phasin [Roseiarcus sp.]